jgi:hypothetical protein
MASMISGRALRQSNYGITVAKAAVNLPATTTGTIFTVSNAPILLMAIWGRVTTVIQTQANTLSLSTLSGTGSVVSNLTAGVDVTGAAVGTYYGITGVRTDAAVLGSNVPTPNELIIPPGVIRWTTTATSTGAMAWNLMYIPLEDGATVS